MLLQLPLLGTCGLYPVQLVYQEKIIFEKKKKKKKIKKKKKKKQKGTGE